MSTLVSNKPSAVGSSTLIDSLLAQERSWTAVDQFSDWHQEARTNSYTGEKSYHQLIPVTEPGKGQQFGFEVDLDKCSGCKACVVACHSLNGLEETETWRKVGLLIGAPAAQQHVTTSCHHCVDPGCLNGCPVLAYEKDPLTGIVRHLDDQCIGCQYCIMKCPYEVPQYSSRLGIVRKCDMCYHRLSAGEAPACVQACPSEAIRINIVDQSSLTAAFRGHRSEVSKTGVSLQVLPEIQARTAFLPDSPDPSITVPTTRFISGGGLKPTLAAADQFSVRLEQGHLPLVFMLLLSQAAAGLLVVGCLFANTASNQRWFAIPALSLLAVGSLAAVLHLGRPLRAWRALLGWRTSWLSRELFVLGCFGGACALAAIATPRSPVASLAEFVAAVLGALTVFASAMVYIDTRRAAWKPRITLLNFFGAMFLLGAVGAAAVVALAGIPLAAKRCLAAAVLIRCSLFIWRGFEHLHALSHPHSPIHLNHRVIPDLLAWTEKADAILFIVFVIASLMALATPNALVWIGVAGAVAFLCEVINRYLFFATSAGKRMPGGILA